jgi:hypothetical protein
MSSRRCRGQIVSGERMEAAYGAMLGGKAVEGRSGE